MDWTVALLYLSFLLSLALLGGQASGMTGDDDDAALVVSNCDALRFAIEAAASPRSRDDANGSSSNSDAVVPLRLRLDGDFHYHCNSSIRVSQSQSVVVVGDGSTSLRVNDMLLLENHHKNRGLTPQRLGSSRPSGDGLPALFVNEGTLRLENLAVQLPSRQADREKECSRRWSADVRAAAAPPPEAGGCGVRLVRNSGSLVIVNSSVTGSSYSKQGGGALRSCSAPMRGQVVYSEGGRGGDATVLSVQRSNFSDISPSCGVLFHAAGHQAFNVDGSRLHAEDEAFPDATPSNLSKKDDPSTIIHAGPGVALSLTASTIIASHRSTPYDAPRRTAIFCHGATIRGCKFVVDEYIGPKGGADTTAEATPNSQPVVIEYPRAAVGKDRSLRLSSAAEVASNRDLATQQTVVDGSAEESAVRFTAWSTSGGRDTFLMEHCEFRVARKLAGGGNLPLIKDTTGGALGVTTSPTAAGAVETITNGNAVCGIIATMITVAGDGHNVDCVSTRSVSSKGGAVAATLHARAGRRLAGDIVIDQGLLLIILTAGLVLVLAMLCCADIWLRNHPRHRLASICTFPGALSIRKFITRKFLGTRRGGNARNTAPSPPPMRPSSPFSSYTMSDEGISHVVPFDVQAVLARTGANRDAKDVEDGGVSVREVGAFRPALRVSHSDGPSLATENMQGSDKEDGLDGVVSGLDVYRAAMSGPFISPALDDDGEVSYSVPADIRAVLAGAGDHRKVHSPGRATLDTPGFPGGPSLGLSLPQLTVSPAGETGAQGVDVDVGNGKTGKRGPVAHLDLYRALVYEVKRERFNADYNDRKSSCSSLENTDPTLSDGDADENADKPIVPVLGTSVLEGLDDDRDVPSRLPSALEAYQASMSPSSAVTPDIIERLEVAKSMGAICIATSPISQLPSSRSQSPAAEGVGEWAGVDDAVVPTDNAKETGPCASPQFDVQDLEDGLYYSASSTEQDEYGGEADGIGKLFDTTATQVAHHTVGGTRNRVASFVDGHGSGVGVAAIDNAERVERDNSAASPHTAGGGPHRGSMTSTGREDNWSDGGSGDPGFQNGPPPSPCQPAGAAGYGTRMFGGATDDFETDDSVRLCASLTEMKALGAAPSPAISCQEKVTYVSSPSSVSDGGDGHEGAGMHDHVQISSPPRSVRLRSSPKKLGGVRALTPPALSSEEKVTYVSSPSSNSDDGGESEGKGAHPLRLSSPLHRLRLRSSLKETEDTGRQAPTSPLMSGEGTVSDVSSPSRNSDDGDEAERKGARQLQLGSSPPRRLRLCSSPNNTEELGAPASTPLPTSGEEKMTYVSSPSSESDDGNKREDKKSLHSLDAPSPPLLARQGLLPGRTPHSATDGSCSETSDPSVACGSAVFGAQTGSVHGGAPEEPETSLRSLMYRCGTPPPYTSEVETSQDGSGSAGNAVPDEVGGV